MKCGECLMRDVKFVELVNGKCPVCGADYTDLQAVKNAVEPTEADIQAALDFGKTAEQHLR